EDYFSWKGVESGRRTFANSGFVLMSGPRLAARAIRCRARCIFHGKRLMWPQNAFTDRLNLKWPILQAPMGWLSTPALAAAVSNAGGLGGLGMWGFSAEDAERRIAGFQQLSGGSLNVNYPLW